MQCKLTKSSVSIRAVAKPTTFLTACLVMGEKNPAKLKKQPNDIRNTNKIRAELATKFFTYLCMGFNSMFVAPVVFQVSRSLPGDVTCSC